eukprot:gene8170-12630_t
MSQKTIELGLPVDSLREGLSQHKTEIDVHPLQNELQKTEKKDKRQKYFTLSNVYGSSMPMNMEMEKQLVSHSLRLPGLNSERVGFETLTNDLNFGFEDYLDQADFSETGIDLHSSMESQLGINVKMRF